MKLIGNTLAALAIVVMALGGTITLGAVTASLDRDRVSLGDTLRLTLTATEDEDLNAIDLQPLLGDFEILQRSSSSNTSIVNGRMSQSRQLLIDLTPTRQGNLQIAPLQVGKNTTPGLPVIVSDAPDTLTGEQHVVFEAEVDQDSVYVQGQIILTLRLQQSVNLEDRSISELKLDNAFVKPLEQHSFQRTIDGRQWLVDEVRFAIFPEQSGTLEIPAQVFSGRVSQGRRSFFDLGRGGQLLRRSTEALAINVLPKPDSFTADTWLPARDLTLEESWSTPPEQLRVGESATRTIRILGEGLQGAQLPPILFTPSDGLKYYPDQPRINEQEVASGLLGVREDSAAIVPTRAGTYLIPEIRIPWWDTRSKQVRYAVLPEREITVAAAEPGSSSAALAAPSAAVDSAAEVSATTAPHSLEGQFPIWQILSAVSTLGWLLTLIYWWRQRRQGRPVTPNTPDTTSEKQAFKQLLAASADCNASGAREAIIAWVSALTPEAPATSLDQIALQFGDEEFTRELNRLDAHLYSPQQGNWVGASLADCARRLRSKHHESGVRSNEQLRLYPQSS